MISKITQADDLLDKILKDPNAGNVLPYANFWKGEIALPARPIMMMLSDI